MGDLKVVLDKSHLDLLLRQSSVYVRGKTRISPVKWMIRNGELMVSQSSQDRVVGVIGKYGKAFFEKIEGEGELVFEADKVIRAIDRLFRHAPYVIITNDGDNVVFEDKDGRSRLTVPLSAEDVYTIKQDMITWINGVPMLKRKDVDYGLWKADLTEIGRLEPKERITFRFMENVIAGGEIVKGSYAEVRLKTELIRKPGVEITADYPSNVVCPFAKTVKVGGILGIHIDVSDNSPGPLVIGEKQQDHVVVVMVVPMVSA